MENEGNDRRKKEQRSLVERRQTDRRKRWEGAEVFDYEAEREVFGRREKERRSGDDRRLDERRIGGKERRVGLPERRGLPGVRNHRATDVIYKRTIVERELPAEEGVGRLVTHGKKSSEELAFKPGEVPSRPQDTAEAIATSPSSKKPGSRRNIRTDDIPSARIYRPPVPSYPVLRSPDPHPWTKFKEWLHRFWKNVVER